jgi:hypothetical protein
VRTQDTASRETARCGDFRDDACLPDAADLEGPRSFSGARNEAINANDPAEGCATLFLLSSHRTFSFLILP